MTPDRLESLVNRVRTIAENNPQHAGLCAWQPTRPYLLGDNTKELLPLHGENAIVWTVREVATGEVITRSANFARAVAGLV